MRGHHWLFLILGGYLLIGVILAVRALSAIGSLTFSGFTNQAGTILLWPFNLQSSNN